MRERPAILIADNEPNIRTVLRALLERENYVVTAVANGLEAQQVLLNHAPRTFSAVITDLKMPEMDGMALLHWIRKNIATCPVIMITAFATVDTAVEALKNGAFDYITKPFDLDEMKGVVEKACRTQNLAQKEFLLPDTEGRQLISQNAAMLEIYRLIDKIASSPSPVLITGESGTGKGLIAQAIHRQSHRHVKPFIQVNCAAIPAGLIESELFGYERGAFTGAVTSKPGRFELAHGGSLFLDEIGEMSLDLQVKLLRAVQHKTFERVGGVQSLQVDARLITATNRDLTADVHAERFRQDLYYRLNVIPIHVPPLRQRIDDIPLLSRFFVKRFAEKLGRPSIEIAPETLGVFARYGWPGNIRELENVIERAMVLSEGPILQPQDLPKEILGQGPTPALEATDLKEAVRQQSFVLEREWIQKALEKTHGNVTQAAKDLRISRKSLQLKMRQYGLREEESD